MLRYVSISPAGVLKIFVRKEVLSIVLRKLSLVLEEVWKSLDARYGLCAGWLNTSLRNYEGRCSAISSTRNQGIATFLGNWRQVWNDNVDLSPNKNLQGAVKIYQNTLADILYEKSIEKLIYQYNKCVNLHSNWVEKQLWLYFTFGYKTICYSLLSLF